MISAQPAPSSLSLPSIPSLNTATRPPTFQLNRLQLVQICIVRAVVGVHKSFHTTLSFKFLHWLKITKRINYILSFFLASKFLSTVDELLQSLCDFVPFCYRTTPSVNKRAYNLLLPLFVICFRLVVKAMSYQSYAAKLGLN